MGAKDREDGDTVMDVAIPVPESGTVCGLPGALSANDRLALSAVANDGVKVTETVQVPAAASVVVHVLEEIKKSAALVPVTVMLEIFSAAVPVFVRVVVSGADVLLTF